jgi:hypothetical protein
VWACVVYKHRSYGGIFILVRISPPGSRATYVLGREPSTNFTVRNLPSGVKAFTGSSDTGWQHLQDVRDSVSGINQG